VSGRLREFAIGDQGDLAGGHGGKGEQEESRDGSESAHAHSLRGFIAGRGRPAQTRGSAPQLPPHSQLGEKQVALG
jgi:hypothetical protein